MTDALRHVKLSRVTVQAMPSNCFRDSDEDGIIDALDNQTSSLMLIKTADQDGVERV